MPLSRLSRDVEEDANDEDILGGISLTNQHLNSTVLEAVWGVFFFYSICQVCACWLFPVPNLQCSMLQLVNCQYNLTRRWR